MTRPLSLPLLCQPSQDRRESLAVQVYRDLLAAVRDGRLTDGATLPSSRAAAGELKLSRHTINNAYDLLRAEGAIAIRRGAVPRVVAGAKTPSASPAPTSRSVSDRGARLARNPRAGATPETGIMAPGEPDEALFPADEWARALRRAARRSHGAVSSYADPWGVPALRRIIAERLSTDRGIAAVPEQVLVTTGTQSSLALVAQVLTASGDVAALEDPGYLGARAAFQAAGLTLAPIPVDTEGAIPDAVPRDARLIYLTPSNQYPTGVRLSHTRRAAFLDRARATGALILEDDYDSEFLWRGREIAALSAEARSGETIYLGSAAKVLMPALRIGWMVVPKDLVEPLRAAQRNLGLMANLHAQIALAEIMEAGRYRVQLKRIARTYESRGHALAEALSSVDGLSVRLPDGGLQVAARIEDGRSEAAAIAALDANGFRPARLSAYCLEGRQAGLVIGFADATPKRIETFARVLGAVR